MIKRSTQTDLPTLTSDKAAEFLAEQIGGKREHWLTWLKNDRRPGRANHIPQISGPGRPRYYRHDVESYVEHLKATKPGVRERAEAHRDTDAPVLNMAVMLDDGQLQQELLAARWKSTPIDLVAFEVLAGDDQNGQPTIWIQSGLRGGMHLAITLPFTSEEVQAQSREQTW